MSVGNAVSKPFEFIQFKGSNVDDVKNFLGDRFVSAKEGKDTRAEIIMKTHQISANGHEGIVVYEDQYILYYPNSERYDVVPESAFLKDYTEDMHDIDTTVAGYTPKTDEGKIRVNRIKAAESILLGIIDDLYEEKGSDPCWLNTAKTDIQKGVMCACRAVFKPAERAMTMHEGYKHLGEERLGSEEFLQKVVDEIATPSILETESANNERGSK